MPSMYGWSTVGVIAAPPLGCNLPMKLVMKDWRAFREGDAAAYPVLKVPQGILPLKTGTCIFP